MFISFRNSFKIKNVGKDFAKRMLIAAQEIRKIRNGLNVSTGNWLIFSSSITLKLIYMNTTTTLKKV